MPTSNFLSKNDFLQALRERVDVSKALLSEMFDILPYLRKWGMLVAVYNDTDPINNGLYMLKRNKASNIISDNANWDKVDAYPRISGIISGGNVSWTGEGLIFQVGITEYIIDTNYYVLAAPVLVVLEHSDPDYPRFDTFYVDINGNAGVITGTPAADPSIPSVDTNTQIYLTSVLVGAGAIIPNIDTLIVYNENTEWTGSTQNNITANFNATNNPSKGIKNVDVTNIYRLGIITFSGEAMKLSDYTSIELDICLKEVMKSTQYLYIRVLLNNAPKCAYKILNISKLYDGYQTIKVPISTLGATADEINQVSFMWGDLVANELIPHAGFDLDYVRFTGGINPPALLDTIELIGDVLADGVVGSPVIVRLNPESTQTSLSLTDKLYLKTNLGLLRDITWENILKQVVITTDGTTITGTGTTSDPVKSNVFNADEAGDNLPQRSKIQGGEYIEYTDDDVNSKTIIDIKPDKLEEATELESEVIELEQADELESETFLNPDWEETDPTKISYIQNKPTISGSLWEGYVQPKIGYGFFYNWYAVQESIGHGGFIEGFTVPTESQWGELITLMGGDSVAGGKLKSQRTEPNIHPRWVDGNVSTNDVNFSALPSGGPEYGNGEDVRFWTKTVVDYLGAIYIKLLYNSNQAFISDDSKTYMCSIRLIRELTASELLLTDGAYLDNVIDFNKNTYQVVKIGSYGWLAQNLMCSNYIDGESINLNISYISDPNPLYSFYKTGINTPGIVYSDETINSEVIIRPKNNKFINANIINGFDNSKFKPKPIEIRSGYLYNWFALEYIANTGWRVPTESDWDALALLIDPNYSKVFGENNYNSLIGRALSLNDRRFWKYMLAETEQAYNEAQFNAVGTGDRSDTTGLFGDKRVLTRFASSTIDINNKIAMYSLEVGGYSILESYDNDRFFYTNWDDRKRGMSVRLCRDATMIELDIPDYSRMADYVGNDGKSYKTVKIGSLVWMAENLCETIYNTGIAIQELITNSQWEEAISGYRCSYNNDETNSLLFNNFITPKLEKKINQFDIIQQPFEYLPFTPDIYYIYGHGQNRDNTNGINKKIEADGSFTLYISEFQNGDTGTLRIHNTDSNPITITLSTGFTNKGIGSISNLASNTHYLLTWVFDGDVFMYRIEQLT